MNRVSTSENKVPPIITTPMPIRLVEAAPKDRAIGKAPSAIVKLVIKMGRKRDSEAIKIDSDFDNPCSLS